MIKHFTLIAMAAFSTIPLYAQDLTDEKLDSLEKAWSRNFDEVVVTGTRTPKLLKDSPILTRVITTSDIKKTDATDISDLLQAELPGIEFS